MNPEALDELDAERLRCAVLALAIGTLAGLDPALRAARLAPSDALRS